MSGETARRLARHGSPIPLLAFTPEPATRSQLALTWGVETFIVPAARHTDDMVRQVETALLGIGRCAPGDKVVMVAGSPPGTPGKTNALRVHRIGDAIASGLTRLTRTLGLDRNPLRRAADRAEAWTRVGLVAVFLVAGPVAVLGAGHWAGHAKIAAAQTSAMPTYLGQAAPQHPPTIAADLYGSGQVDRAESGTRREAGRSVRGPAVLVELLVLAVMALTLMGALRLTHAFVTMRRLAAWEAAWSRVGPQWSRRRP